MQLKTIYKVFILQLYNNYSRSISKILLSKKYNFLLQHIYDNTQNLTLVGKSLNKKYKLKTYLYWYFNDIKSFSDNRCCCDLCKTPLTYRDVMTALIGYYRYNGSDHKYCSKCRYFCSDKQKEKRSNTWLKKYNVKHISQSEIIKNKIKHTNIEKYGVDNPFKSAAIQHKIKETLKSKYNVEYTGSIPTRIDKMKATNIKKYGVCCNLITNKQKNDTKKKLIEKYGVARPPVWKYLYDNISFDSLPELAYYIWLKDNNIKFEYQPNLDIIIYDENKICHYFPDFLLIDTNQLVEIKGDQFFDKNNFPINPYNGKSWKIKYDWMIKNNVKILRKKEYNIYIEYCSKKFNNTKWYFKYKKQHH